MLTMYVIEFEKEKMILRVPIEKTKEIGVRKVSTKNQLKEIFEILTGKAKIRRTMWSRRAQEYEAKINSGDIKLLTEVVRDLFRVIVNQNNLIQKDNYMKLLERDYQGK